PVYLFLRKFSLQDSRGGSSVLVDAQQEHPFAAIWGDGHVSSSDGQFFPAGGRGEASLEYNAKYGKRPGASIYGFLSNRFASFFPE
ncbi:Tn3 family transposase, partial [Escherichia coli]|nr:Tn3 family transposase [Escherichia coli]